MEISANKILGMHVLIVCALGALHFVPADAHATVHNRFDLDAEANIPTWFSTTCLFEVSLVSFLIHCSCRRNPAGTSFRWFWLIFSATYCFLSLDEAARIHEISDDVFHVKWIYVYAPVFGAFFSSVPAFSPSLTLIGLSVFIC